MTSAPLTDEDIERMDEVAAGTSDIAALVHEVKIWRELWGGLAQAGDYGLVLVVDEDGELTLVSHPTAAAETVYPDEQTVAFLRNFMGLGE